MKQDHMQEVYNRGAYKFGDMTNLVSKDERAKIEWFLKNSRVSPASGFYYEIAPGSGGCYSILKEAGVTRYAACDTGDFPVAQFNLFFPESREFLVKEEALTALNKFSDGTLDCVIGCNIFEHLENDYLIELMHLLKKKLRPDGELWIHGPCAESILSSYSRYCDLTHKRSFTLKTFYSMGSMFGFEVHAFSGKQTGVKNLTDVVRFLQRKIVYWIDRFVFMFEIGYKKGLGVFSPDISVILLNKK